MAAAHEFALFTRFTSTIKRIDFIPNIAHPLSFSPIIQDMDDRHEAGNAPDLHHYLKKLDTYVLKFYQRTQESTYKIKQPTAFVCTECFGPHNIKECNKHKIDYESEEINDQESENDDEESDEQRSEYEDETETSAQYNEVQCMKYDSTFDCPSTYHGNQPLCQGCSDYLHQYKRQRFQYFRLID